MLCTSEQSQSPQQKKTLDRLREQQKGSGTERIVCRVGLKEVIRCFERAVSVIETRWSKQLPVKGKTAWRKYTETSVFNRP